MPHDRPEAVLKLLLVMQYVEGKDLAALVKKNGPFSVAQAIDYTLQAARGLEFVHKKGVIHRDIKPGNLLLDSQGTIKILDMGLARIDSSLHADGASPAESTASGAIMGTVDYMSPEQAHDTKKADARADIYSLGCTLYYLLSGRTVYGGETLMEIISAHRKRPIPSLKNVRADLPNELDATFRKMVAKSVDTRYQTMAEVITDFERCAAAFKSQGQASPEDTPETMLLAPDKAKPNGTASVSNHVAMSKSSEGRWSDRKRFAVLGVGAACFAAVLCGAIVVYNNTDERETGRNESSPHDTARAAAAKSATSNNSDYESTPDWTKPFGSEQARARHAAWLAGAVKTESNIILKNSVPYALAEKVTADLAAAGNRPAYIDTYLIDGQLLFHFAYVPNDGRAWELRWNLTEAAWQQKNKEVLSKGLKLSSGNTYLENGDAKRCALWLN